MFGIIDRDYRTDQEIEGLMEIGVHTIDVAEIENILLNESTLRIVAKNQHLEPDAVVSKALETAKNLLSKDVERQASLRTCRVLENKLSRIDNKSVGLDAIKLTVAETLGGIDVERLFTENSELYTNLTESDNLDEILKYFNNKGLLSSICTTFELGKNGYEKLVLRMLNSEKRDEILNGLRKYVPEI